jgi:hypothetical protein
MNPIQLHEYGRFRGIIPPPFITTWDTTFTQVGSSEANQIKLPLQSTETYNFDVDWGDGTKDTITSWDQAETLHTYTTGGSYTIKIKGTFPKFYFNNGKEIGKLKGIDDWGGVEFSTDQTNAFYGCWGLTYVPPVTSDSINAVTVGDYMFAFCAITSLPEDMLFPNVTTGKSMFRENQLPVLPSAMRLNSLIDGYYMFANIGLTEIPAGMDLPSIENGSFMFYFNSALTTVPESMTLATLINGTDMFSSCSIDTLPSGMELPLLDTGRRMFYGCDLTSLPPNMNLPMVTSGYQMFYNNNLTDLPVGMTLPMLDYASKMFFGNTINTTRYSQLLIDLESGNPNNNFQFGGGNSKYNSSGETARNILTSAPRSLTITDGGLQA